MRVFARSVAVSAIVFAIELLGVVVLDVAGARPAASFAFVQIAGTLISFVLNKYWAFDAAATRAGAVEGAKSLVVFAGSFVLNIVVPTAACAQHVPAAFAFTAAQIAVGLAWTYPLNRHWVFSATQRERA